MSNKRLSDVIFDSYNRFYYSKKSGGMAPTEYAYLIENIGNLVANRIKQGKMTEEEINDINSYLPLSEFFNVNHEGLDIAKKTFIEGNDMALASRNNRFSFSHSVSSNNYTEGFKRL